jgi:hypothetical protein
MASIPPSKRPAAAAPPQPGITSARADAMLRSTLTDAVRRLAMRGWIDRTVVLSIVETAQIWLQAHR